MPILRAIRRSPRTFAVLGLLSMSSSLVACAGESAPAQKAGDGAPISSALPPLPQLSQELRDVVPPDVELAFAGDSVRVMISVEAAARVNALLPPVIEEKSGRRFTLLAPSVTEDSAYFVERASVTVARSALPIRGTLRTSFCRSDERLCRSAEREVLLEDR